MLVTLLMCVFGDPKYDSMTDYPFPENKVNFYHEGMGDRDRMPWETFKPLLAKFISILEERNIYRGMVVSGYMSRRVAPILEKTTTLGILERLVAELKHEHNGRKENVNGNPDLWTNQDTQILTAYEELLKKEKEKEEKGKGETVEAPHPKKQASLCPCSLM